MPKEGRKTKDAPITENFNPDKTIKLNRAELAAAKRQAVRDNRQAKLDDEERRRLRKEKKAFEKQLLDEKLRELARVGLEATEEEKEAEKRELALEAAGKGSTDPEDEQSAYQMLQDMRYVYRKVKGRTKLRDLIASDDKQFVFMVKELMKIEAQLMSAKIRAKEDLSGSAQQTVFVVLKGLEDDPRILDVSPVEDTDIDQRQIAAALTPEGKEYSAG